MFVCKHCKKEFLDLSVANKANHTRWCDLNPKKEQYKNHLDKLHSDRIGTTISNEHKNKIILAHENGRYSSNLGNSFRGKTHSKETKDKMSLRRANYLKENPDLHPWKRNDKFLSIPCQIVKDHLMSKNVSFVEEFCPLEDRFFSIDIAFPEIKVGIEINGNQHYKSNGKLLPYYQQRHDLIVDSGWMLFELPYTIAYDLSKIDAIVSKLNV